MGEHKALSIVLPGMVPVIGQKTFLAGRNMAMMKILLRKGFSSISKSFTLSTN
jgi:hypothetical protein